MLKPGVDNKHLISSNAYSKNKLEKQVSYYCKSEGLDISHYVYLMENNCIEDEKNKSSIITKNSLGILGIFSVICIIIYQLF